MAVYMIDYENVKTGGLNGISRLTDADRVIIFYSENANRLTFDLHQRLMASTAKIEYREVTVGGHNALDFQLVTYLGFLIAQDPGGQYLIISNDRGFEYVVNFWRRDGLSIGLLPYLKDPNYALQKALRPDGKPAAAAIASAEEDFAEEPAEQPAPEPEVIVAEEPEPEEAVAAAETAAEPIVAEEPAAEETAADAAAEVAPQPAPEVIFADAAADASAPAEPEELPAEALQEQPKPSRKKKRTASGESKQNTPKKPDKPADQSAEKSAVKSAKKKEEKKEQKAEPVGPAEVLSAGTRAELRAMLGDSVADDPELRLVLDCVEKYKTKLGLNNALVKHFGNQKAGEIYQKLKPLLSAKKTAEPAAKQKKTPAPKPKKEKAAVS